MTTLSEVGKLVGSQMQLVKPPLPDLEQVKDKINSGN